MDHFIDTNPPPQGMINMPVPAGFGYNPEGWTLLHILAEGNDATETKTRAACRLKILLCTYDVAVW